VLRAIFNFLFARREDIPIEYKIRREGSLDRRHIPPSRPTHRHRIPSGHEATKNLKGKCYVIDGDTIVISGAHIRLAGIDAPELDQPWGKKAKFALVALCKGQIVTADIQEDVSYDRLVAKCYLPDGTDLAAELVQQGLALDWAKFSGGAYRHLEPAGVRKKLWRVTAKHQGRYKSRDQHAN
jgi:micrococcal nuclease